MPVKPPSQHIQKALAGAAVASPRSSSPDHILKSLHWLKLQERIEYKVISTTYKVLQCSSPPYLRGMIAVQPFRSTHSSSLVTLLQPPVLSSLKITNCSFCHAALHLWNKLPPSLQVPYCLDVSLISSSSSASNPVPVLDLCHVVFHSCLKTHLFTKSFPP